MNDSDLNDLVDLSNCEKEPIHIPNKIQPFGFLLVVNLSNYHIIQCSLNISKFIEMEPADILGIQLFNLISKNEVDQIREAIDTQRLSYINPIDLHFGPSQISFRSTVHISDGILIIDSEPFDTVIFSDYYSAANRLMEDFRRAKAIPELSNILAENIRLLTQYDRVMVYQFDEEWNGTVIAESRGKELYSFLGQHFPASDIPRQARELYIRNPIRIIPDVDYLPVKITPDINPLSLKFIDLSKSSLRSVSPIHIEYLQNMGVKSTLVVSVLVNDKLWGLITCHHYKPKFLDSKMRSMLEHFGNIFAYNVDLLQNLINKDIDLRANLTLSELLRKLNKGQDFFNGLSKSISLLLQLNSATGVVLLYGNHFFKEGITPDKEFIIELIDWLFLNYPEPIVYSNCLSNMFEKVLPFVSIASGMIAMRLSKFEKNYILWFKPEMIQTVIWGGNPKEKILAIPNQDGFRLSPRKSFEKWEEVVRRHSIPWEKSEIRFMEKLRLTFQEMIANNMSFLENQNIELNIKIQEKILEVKAANQQLQKVSEQIQEQNEKLRIQNKDILVLYDELRKHKNQLKAIFDNTKHIIFLLDTEGKILFFNQVAAQNARFLHERNLMHGEKLTSYARTKEEAEQVDVRFQKAINGESFVIEEEYFHEKLNNSSWFRVEYDPVYDENNLIGVAILMTDISLIKMAGKKIQNQNAALREIAFLQSHKVRRPVANILGLISLFNQKDMNDPFNKTVLEKLLFSTQELDDIVRSIVERTYPFDE